MTKCTGCGMCCGDILPVSDAEIETIKQYVADKKIRPSDLEGSSKMKCPFRDEQKQLCQIYEVRPLICKQYYCNHSLIDHASWNELFKSGKVLNAISMRETVYGDKSNASMKRAMAKMLAGIAASERNAVRRKKARLKRQQMKA